MTVNPAPEPVRSPRGWVIAAGAWTALCWLGIVLCVLIAAWSAVLLFLVGLVPVSLLWRFRYWRASRTPEYKVMRKAPTSGFTVDHLTVAMSHNRSLDQGEFDRAMAVADRKQEQRPNLTGRMLQRGVNRGLGGWVAGFVLPVRDAVREYRWANGRGSPPVL